ncbi:hypothetical protein NDU88_005311 [Pleurodeles waltl]|uniref:Uncharacterized protein n=1 Tax=Pleurodeles waltl TaxID=8319 RepID=A0AAV7LMH8_PLEWA|nr:hypothetical protein NDU88_005311 [Pleurodeles waltl]
MPSPPPKEPHDRTRPCHRRSDTSADGAHRLAQWQSTASPGTVFATWGHVRLKGRGQSLIGPEAQRQEARRCDATARTAGPAVFSGRGPASEGLPGLPLPNESSPGSLAPGPVPPLWVRESLWNLQPCRRSSSGRHAAATRFVIVYWRGVFSGAWLGRRSAQPRCRSFSGPWVVLQCTREPR